MIKITPASVKQTQLHWISERKKSLEDEVKGSEDMYFFSKIFVNINRKNEKIRILTKIYNKIKSGDTPIKNDADLLQIITPTELSTLKKGVFSTRTFDMLTKTYKYNTQIVQIAVFAARVACENFSDLVDKLTASCAQKSLNSPSPQNIDINASASIDERIATFTDFAKRIEAAAKTAKDKAQSASTAAETAARAADEAKTYAENVEPDVENQAAAQVEIARAQAAVEFALELEANPGTGATPTPVPDYVFAQERAKAAARDAVNAQQSAQKAAENADTLQKLAKYVREVNNLIVDTNNAVAKAAVVTNAATDDFTEGFVALAEADAFYNKLMNEFKLISQ